MTYIRQLLFTASSSSVEQCTMQVHLFIFNKDLSSSQWHLYIVKYILEELFFYASDMAFIEFSYFPLLSVFLALFLSLSLTRARTFFYILKFILVVFLS